MGHSGIYSVAMIDSTHVKVPRSVGGEKRDLPKEGLRIVYTRQHCYKTNFDKG